MRCPSSCIFGSVIFLAFCLLSACAPQKMTRAEVLDLRKKYDEIRTRAYTGKTPEQILVAVDELFALADDDYEVSHTQNGCMAYRNWNAMIQTGRDYWYVSVTEQNGASKITIREVSDKTAHAFLPTGGGGMQMVTEPSMINPDIIEIKEMKERGRLYNLFFARLDYLLGLGSEWISCPVAIKRARKENGKQEDLNPLCWVASDNQPTKTTHP
jgi:hypothetical protein